MSRLLMKTAALSLVGLAAGAGVMSLMRPSPSPAAFRKIAMADFENGKSPRFMGKHLSVLQVALQTPEGIPDREDQEVTLVGMVRMNRQIDAEVRYRWELPDGVRVVSGHVEDSWPAVKEGEVAEARLTVTGFSKEDLKLIALHGFIQDGETVVGNSATLTSRPEDSIEMLSAAAVGVQTEPKKERPLLTGRIVR